jgi:putative hydrolase of the HAD superfamily
LQSAYDKFLAHYAIDPAQAAMFEDLEKNLVVPHASGMITVHVVPSDDYSHAQVDAWELSRADGLEHVHHVTGDLVDFLRQCG